MKPVQKQQIVIPGRGVVGAKRAQMLGHDDTLLEAEIVRFNLENHSVVTPLSTRSFILVQKPTHTVSALTGA